MSKNPIFPNWQLPRRQAFGARRGVAVLRAWRLRVAEQRQAPHTQTEFVFVHRDALRRSLLNKCLTSESRNSIEFLEL
jgi:hypothetical protein